MKLTPEQQALGEHIQQFIYRGEPGFLVVSGYAGVGKTTTVFNFLNKVDCIVAPTHEALKTVVGSYTATFPDRAAPKHMSLASFLGKSPIDPTPPTPQELELFDKLSEAPELTDTQKNTLAQLRDRITPSEVMFVDRGVKPADGLEYGSVVVLDEAGMLTVDALAELETYSKKLLFVLLGDPAQCPPIDGNRADGEPSKVFSWADWPPLTQVMRSDVPHITEQTRLWREAATCNNVSQVLSFLGQTFSTVPRFRKILGLTQGDTVVITARHDRVFEAHQLLYESRIEKDPRLLNYGGYEAGDTLISYGNFRDADDKNKLRLGNSSRLTVIKGEEACDKTVLVWGLNHVTGAMTFTPRFLTEEDAMGPTVGTTPLLYGEEVLHQVFAKDAQGNLFYFHLPRLGYDHHTPRTEFTKLYKAIVDGKANQKRFQSVVARVFGAMGSQKNAFKDLNPEEIRALRRFIAQRYLEVRDCRYTGYASLKQDSFPDIRHGCAMTIHKSQGATIPNVLVDIESIRDWASGWNARPLDAAMMGYTAVSRAKLSLGYTI